MPPLLQRNMSAAAKSEEDSVVEKKTTRSKKKQPSAKKQAPSKRKKSAAIPPACVTPEVGTKRRNTRSSSSSVASSTPATESATPPPSPKRKNECLSRTREQSLQKKNPNLLVIGVDEAGRGPIAGPVVAAAAIVPATIPGITDSKKITQESDREVLYEELIKSPGLRWSVAVIDAKRIDEINILQATLEGMKKAAKAVMSPPWDTPRILEASAKEKGCYVVFGVNDANGNPIETPPEESEYHTLIDGNKIPGNMPCPTESIIKGDSREYCIGAASILAKVTRDRIMNEYDAMYPEYNLAQHKGYPTARHMSLVKEIGPCEIHRRSFAPLKVEKKEKNVITSYFKAKKK